MALATLLAAGCANGRAAGQAGADTSTSTVDPGVGASSTATTKQDSQASTTKGATGASPSTTGPRSATFGSGRAAPSSTTRRRNTTTTRRTTPTTKPPVKPRLTISIVENGNANGSAQVSPGGGTCSSSCSYSFSKGTTITLDPDPIEAQTDWVFGGPGGGQTSCDAGNPCSFTLDLDTTVQVVFGDTPEEAAARPISS